MVENSRYTLYVALYIAISVHIMWQCQCSLILLELVLTAWKWAVTWQNQQSDCVPSEDSDQPGHLPSLIRVFAVHMKKAWVLSYPLSAQPRLWSDWADAQADLSLRWVHSHFNGFVMLRLKCYWPSDNCDTTELLVKQRSHWLLNNLLLCSL